MLLGFACAREVYKDPKISEVRGSFFVNLAPPHVLLLLVIFRNPILKVETATEMENPESVKKAVQSGFGIAYIFKFRVETELKAKSLVIAPVRSLDIKRRLN